ncbi:Protein ERD1-like protein 1 [Golovinomyces cichoracearum]|uniref:Protein ERD1-like protein 1 n=1 Tax=Golovinomyces cichoracearum TaxID=62708 RepID=A0A420HIA4_9PEZI|nr:Protein ERD1-like protein 1 [Golovinomyces cichoracearum]
MNSDPAVEPRLEYVGQILPLPYRISVAIVLGVWAWGANLQCLSLYKIDVLSLVYPQRALSRTSSSPYYLSTYRLALVLTGPLIFSLFITWVVTQSNGSFTIYFDFLPMIYLCFLVGICTFPIRNLCPSGRSRFLATLRRILVGGLAQTKDGKFGDILLADMLTSYAKIIADLFVALCMFFRYPLASSTVTPDRSCGGLYAVPIITAIPSFLRLLQCLTEYFRVQSAGGPGWGGQHLANVLKYFSAFPVIVLSALQRNVSVKGQNLVLEEQSIFYCWLAAISLNSLYSFYWDVAKDWDLDFFSVIYRHLSFAHRSSPTQLNVSHLSTKYACDLRSLLILSDPIFYYIAIILDFFLRFSWLLKLSPHLSDFFDSEDGIVLLEFAEVGRRWMWIFLRLETEWVRQVGERGEPVLNDILVERYDEYESDDY